MPLRFGCHDFLNSQPVLFPLTSGRVKPPFDITLDSPAKLSDMMRNGQLDIAFIPAIEFAKIPGLKLVPGFSIAAKGDVKTVIMHSQKEMKNIRSVSVDRRSRTSVALLKVLLKEFHKKDISFVEQGERADAELVIGDDAFAIPAKDRHVYDLAGEWFRFTGKPFVFAVLCVAEDTDASAALEIIKKAKEAGKGMTDLICRTHQIGRRFGMEVCRDYLENRIRYDLAKEDLEGLKLFYRLAVSHGIIDRIPELPPVGK